MFHKLKWVTFKRREISHFLMPNSKNQREVSCSSLIHLRTSWKPWPTRKCNVSENSRLKNRFEYHFDHLFHDPFNRYCEWSKLWLLFLLSYCEQSPRFAPSIDRKRTLLPPFQWLIGSLHHNHFGCWERSPLLWGPKWLSLSNGSTSIPGCCRVL